MTYAERNQIKELLKNTFWQFEDTPLETITPKLVRQFAVNHLNPKMVESTAISMKDRDFWYRAEKLCHLTKQLHHWHSL